MQQTLLGCCREAGTLCALHAASWQVSYAAAKFWYLRQQLLPYGLLCCAGKVEIWITRNTNIHIYVSYIHIYESLALCAHLFCRATLCIGACHKAAANMADIRGDNAHDVAGCKWNFSKRKVRWCRGGVEVREISIVLTTKLAVEKWSRDGERWHFESTG